MGHRLGGVLAVVAAATLAASAWCAAGAGAQTVGLPVTPIPTDPQNGSVNPFEGSAASPNAVGDATAPPQNPFMAPNGRNNIHNDAYMTDTYRFSGPLTGGLVSSTLLTRECASVLFDSQGRIVTICVGLDRPVLALLDPHTLQTLAAMPLPVRNLQSGSNPFTDFSGGGYFYLDNQDRAVLSTNDRHLLEVGITPAPGFVVTHDYDLSGQIAANDGVISALPDWRGRFWFVTRLGVVGTVDRASGAVRTLHLNGEGISNSFAIDETGGVFIVSDKALYRFDAGPGGEPKVAWRAVYPNSGVRKPGQSDAGSGTTPTLMGKDWVAITDNADPMDVVVYQRGEQAPAASTKKKKKKKHKHRSVAVSSKKHHKKKRRKKPANQAKERQICKEPVFRQGASATDQSLIATDKAMVVENNYGYSGVTATMNGGVTEPGLTRVDVVKQTTKSKKKKKKKKKKKRRGVTSKVKRPKAKAKTSVSYQCKTIWTSDERAPSVVPKLSLTNGLVYTYTKPKRSDNLDAWFLTTLDFRNGRTVYRRLSGTGFGYNNNYAPVTIGPDGTAYVGVLGGLVAFR
jgi:hypothetical protein